MTDNKYNGWTNRETWLVNLWFGDYFQENADDGFPQPADTIKDFIDDYISEIVPNTGFIADLINTQDINWSEIADHIDERQSFNIERI